MNYLYFDVETTGLQRSSDILEFGGVLCDENFEVIKLINEYFYYSDPIPYSAVSVHGLTNQKLEFLAQRDFLTAAPEIYDLVSNKNICLCGHNIVSYDIPVLKSNLNRSGISWDTDSIKTIDTLQLSKSLYSGSHKLEQVLQYCLHRSGCTQGDIDTAFKAELKKFPDLIVDNDATYHSALYDAFICWCIHMGIR